MLLLLFFFSCVCLIWYMYGEEALELDFGFFFPPFVCLIRSICGFSIRQIDTAKRMNAYNENFSALHFAAGRHNTKSAIIFDCQPSENHSVARTSTLKSTEDESRKKLLLIIIVTINFSNCILYIQRWMVWSECVYVECVCVCGWKANESTNNHRKKAWEALSLVPSPF